MVTMLISTWVCGSIILTLALAAAAARRTPAPMFHTTEDHALDLNFEAESAASRPAPAAVSTR